MGCHVLAVFRARWRWAEVMPRTSSFFPTLFCGEACDTRELAQLERLATPVRFDGGQTIFSEGDAAKYVFGLSHGVVRLYQLLPDGRRQVVAFASPGDFLAMPLANRFSVSADAIGKVGVCKFPCAGFTNSRARSSSA